MTTIKLNLSLEKTTPVYGYPITLRQGDAGTELMVEIAEGSKITDLTGKKLSFYSDKPDLKTIEDEEQSHFKIQPDKKSFIYTLPNELTSISGSTKNTYFKVDTESTSDFYIHILNMSGIERNESNDYISRVDRILTHAVTDFNLIDGITKTGTNNFNTALNDSKKLMKDFLDRSNADYVNFINNKNIEFKTYLATLDSQAEVVKNKYNALKAQLDALEFPEIGGRNYVLGTSQPLTVTADGNIGSAITNFDISPDLLNINIGDNITISYDLNVKNADDGVTYTGINPWFAIMGPISYKEGMNHINYTKKLDRKFSLTKDGIRVTVDKSKATYTLSHFKVERGNIVTPWTPAPEDKVNVSDTSNWQKQAIFKNGDYLLNYCPEGTDFGEFLKSNSVPLGFSIIRDASTTLNWRIEKESSDYVFGIAQGASGGVYHLEINAGKYSDSQLVVNNLIGKTITATDADNKPIILKITGIS